MVDNINVPFDPYSNYDDLCECLVFLVNRTWVLRGQNEPQNLLVPDVCFSQKPSGTNSVQLNNLRGKKNGTLSLRNTSYTISFDNSIDEDPENQYGVYKIMHFYVHHHLPEKWTGKFFMQKATKVEIKNRMKSGNSREASLTKSFSSHTFERYTKSLARKCHFKDPER